MVGEIDSLQFDHDSVLGDLENARQREVAWRKRALELERAAHAGDDLNGLLRTYGLETGREQLRVLQAILGNEKLSGHLIKAIRQVDATVIRKIVEEQVAPACVDPLCRRSFIGVVKRLFESTTIPNARYVQVVLHGGGTPNLPMNANELD